MNLCHIWPVTCQGGSTAAPNSVKTDPVGVEPTLRLYVFVFEGNKMLCIINVHLSIWGCLFLELFQATQLETCKLSQFCWYGNKLAEIMWNSLRRDLKILHSV